MNTEERNEKISLSLVSGTIGVILGVIVHMGALSSMDTVILTEQEYKETLEVQLDWRTRWGQEVEKAAELAQMTKIKDVTIATLEAEKLSIEIELRELKEEMEQAVERAALVQEITNAVVKQLQ